MRVHGSDCSKIEREKFVKLTAVEVRAFANRTFEKSTKLSDGHGLIMLALPEGGRYWRLRTRIDGKETTLGVGRWPEMSLAQAREKAAEMRADIKKTGVNPAVRKRVEQHQKAVNSESTFSRVADAWLQKWQSTKKKDRLPSPRTVAAAVRRLGYAKAEIGAVPMRSITPPMLHDMIEKITEERGAGVAAVVAQLTGSVAKWAVKKGYIETNPASVLEVESGQGEKGHFAAAVDVKTVGRVLHAIQGYRGSTVVRGALMAAPYLAVRPGELVTMRWSNIHEEGGGYVWRYVSSKKGVQHSVWLVPQVMEILRSMPRKGDWVFPGRFGGHVTGTALADAMRLGIGISDDQTVHGWRATFRTVGAEELGFDVVCMEIQLSHSISSDPLRGAYARAKFENQRREMMQEWANWLDAAREIQF